MQINKLVRDKIPDMILEKGQKVTVRKSNDHRHLEAKLVEEVKEFLESKNKEKLADILEVIDAIIEKNNWTKEEIGSIKNEKAEKKGTFKKGLILENVD